MVSERSEVLVASELVGGRDGTTLNCVEEAEESGGERKSGAISEEVRGAPMSEGGKCQERRVERLPHGAKAGGRAGTAWTI